MDEILTIREREIKNLEKKVELLNDALASKDLMLRDVSHKLELVQEKMERLELHQKQERRMLTKLPGKLPEEPRIYSKSNERKDKNGTI
jgi:hypothetical protein